MREIDLHVYPRRQYDYNCHKMGKLTQEELEDRSSTEKHVPIGASLVGHRAKMLYIHGDPSDYEGGMASYHLSLAKCRLVDSNPARIVWLRDG